MNDPKENFKKKINQTRSAKQSIKTKKGHTKDSKENHEIKKTKNRVN